MDREENTEPLSRFDSDYQIVRELGSGGEGRVYLVRHIRTEQLRAAKYLAVSEETDRLHELHMMKTLYHPSLPEILDILPEDGCVWLILTYVKGRCLDQLGGADVQAETFFSIARQLSEVLCYLHQRDAPILHLDIKPTNLLLKRDGRLVLIDFGAAVRGHPGAVPEQCCGTPGFAAPEQYQKGHYLDVRTDIYGAGAVLYFLLSGNIWSGKGGNVSGVRLKGWRKGAEKTLAHCLAAEMEARYPDSRTFCLAVRKMERRWLRRREWMRIGIAAGVLTLLLAFCIRAASVEYRRKAVHQTQTYEKLLAEADGMGFAQASRRYREAACLRPLEESLYFHLLERILKDYAFSREEEAVLLELLYTVPAGREATVQELLQEKKERYGALAYEIGMAYWYFYEDTGGRTAAANWFAQAAENLSSGEEKREAARIHARIAGYYERLGKVGISGQAEADYWQFWQDLCGLWESENFQKESARIRMQAAKELLACLIMEASELKEKGEEMERIQELLGSIRIFAAEKQTEEEYREQLDEQCSAADAAVRRAYEGKTELP